MEEIEKLREIERVEPEKLKERTRLKREKEKVDEFEKFTERQDRLAACSTLAREPNLALAPQEYTNSRDGTQDIT